MYTMPRRALRNPLLLHVQTCRGQKSKAVEVKAGLSLAPDSRPAAGSKLLAASANRERVAGKRIPTRQRPIIQECSIGESNVFDLMSYCRDASQGNPKCRHRHDIWHVDLDILLSSRFACSLAQGRPSPSILWHDSLAMRKLLSGAYVTFTISCSLAGSKVNIGGLLLCLLVGLVILRARI